MDKELKKKLGHIYNRFTCWTVNDCDNKTPSDDFLRVVKEENPDLPEEKIKEEAEYELEYCGDCGASAKDCPIRELRELVFSDGAEGGQS